MSRTVSFVVKQTNAKKLKVADGTTVRRLRELVASMGYDVVGTETKIRIVRDGSAVIGHIKDEPLRRNDIVVFENEALRLQVSPEVAESYRPVHAAASTATAFNPCSADCCDSRVDALKSAIAPALQQILKALETA